MASRRRIHVAPPRLIVDCLTAPFRAHHQAALRHRHGHRVLASIHQQRPDYPDWNLHIPHREKRKKRKLVGSERFAVSFTHQDADYDWLRTELNFRLKPDYWMSDDEIESFSRQAFDFASQERAKRSFFPTVVVVELDVCTVQQVGETARAVASRAIRPERLIPIYVWPFVPEGVKFDQSGYLSHRRLFWELPRVRLEDADQTRGGVCPVCSRGFAVGDQVYNSLVPGGGCEHACHSHCVFKSFRKGRFECPSCQVHVPSDTRRRIELLEQGGEA